MNAARRPLFFITSGQHPDERADFVDKYFAKQIDLLLAYIRDGKVAGHLRSLHLARSTDRTASTAAQRTRDREREGASSPMCCARCGKKKGLQGVGSESEHSRAMRCVKWPSLLVPQTL